MDAVDGTGSVVIGLSFTVPAPGTDFGAPSGALDVPFVKLMSKLLTQHSVSD